MEVVVAAAAEVVLAAAEGCREAAGVESEVGEASLEAPESAAHGRPRCPLVPVAAAAVPRPSPPGPASAAAQPAATGRAVSVV